MEESDFTLPGLTREAAFRATVLFTEKMRDLGWPSLPGLLGAMQLIGGRPSDPGIEDDWAELLGMLGSDDFSHRNDSFAPQAAYEATFRFLVLQFRRRASEGVDDVVTRLSASAPHEQAREVAEDWQDALAGK